MTFMQALGAVLSLLLVVGAGFFLAARGLFPAVCVQLLPGFITNVSLPPYLACTIVSTLGNESPGLLFYSALIPFLQMCLLFGIAYGAARPLKVPRRRFGLFCACVSNSNTIFIGVPLSLALFGESAIIYVLIYYFASASFFWTVGNYFISRDESQNPEQGEKLANKGGLRNIISAPMLGFLCGLAIITLHLPVPGFIMQGCLLLGQTAAPLALVFIGINLQSVDWKNFRVNRDMVLALAGRLVLSPLLMAAIIAIVSLPPLMGKVYIIQSSLPVLTQAAILSAYYRTDPEFGSLMVCASAILCALTAPLYAALL